MHEAGACKYKRSSFVGIVCALFFSCSLPLFCITYLFTACFTNTHTTYLISLCCEEPPLSLSFPLSLWEKSCGFQLSADDLRQSPSPNTQHTEGEPPAGLSHAKRTFLKLNLQAGQLNKTAPYTFIAQQRLLAWQRPSYPSRHSESTTPLKFMAHLGAFFFSQRQ